MSTTSKKGGKCLSTNTKNNTVKKTNFRNETSSKNVNIFSNSRNNQEKGNPDECLLSVDTFNYNSHSTTVSSVPETKLGVDEGKSSDGDSIFEKETISNDSDVDLFSFEPKTEFDNSSIIFQNNAKFKDIPTLNEFHTNKKQESVAKDKTNSICSDDVTIADLHDSERHLLIGNTKVTVANEIGFEDSDSQLNNQCPICLKTVSKYINHMKACATKHNLSTAQLLSILKLHKKQLTEREELGLKPPAPSFRAKVSPKRKKAIEKKGLLDSNLQLALALSASLQAVEEDEVIQEAEVLKQAGLNEEANKKLSTLEKFGFATNLPPRSLQGGSKSRNLASYMLLRRTKEDRERIITEKVAIILISDDENPLMETYVEKSPHVKSKRVKKFWRKDSYLWNKAQCTSQAVRSDFYVEALYTFVTPSKSEVGEGMRRLSQVPGRLNTPAKQDSLGNEMPPILQAVSEEKRCSSVLDESKSLSLYKTNQLSEDWERVIGDSRFSDVDVRCDHPVTIPAHKLVLFARCPAILNMNATDGKEEIILENCSRDSAFAFLEFVYSGKSSKLSDLSLQELQSLIILADKFNFADLKRTLLLVQNLDREKEIERKVKKGLFIGHLYDKGKLVNEEDSMSKINTFPNSIATQHKNQIIDSVNDTEIGADNPIFSNLYSPFDNGRMSPDMFMDTSVLDSKNHSPEPDDLCMLASLIGKCSGVNSGDNSLHVLDEPADTLTGGSVSFKRKTLSPSNSEDENDLYLKKVRTNSSQQIFISQRINTDPETLDLTQSSCSSGDKSPIMSPVNFDKSNASQVICPVDVEDDYLDNLTQKCSSGSNSFCADTLPPETKESASYDNLKPTWNGYEDNDWFYTDDNTSIKTNVEPFQNCNVLTSNESKISPEIKCVSSDTTPTKCILPDSSSTKSLLIKNAYPSNCSEKIAAIYQSPIHGQNEDNLSLKPPQLDEKVNLCTFKSRMNLNHKFCAVENNVSFNDLTSSLVHSHFISHPPKSTNQLNNEDPGTLSPVHSISSSPSIIIQLNNEDHRSLSPVHSISSSPESITQLNNEYHRALSPVHSISSSPSIIIQLNNEDHRSLSPVHFTSSSPECLTQLNEDHTILNPVNFISSKSNTDHQEDSPQDSPNLKSPTLNKTKETDLKADSLAAMQRLLDDSFEINNSIFESIDDVSKTHAKKDSFTATTKLLESQVDINDSVCKPLSEASAPSKSECITRSNNGSLFKEMNTKNKTLMTPPPKIFVSDQVTPLPDYSSMKTPTLKKELSRFGLKPSLGKRKAKLLLRHIYEQTHPFVAEPSTIVQDPHDIPTATLRQASHVTERTLEPERTYSQNSSSSSVSSAATLPEESIYESEDESLSQTTDLGDIQSSIRNLILNDSELHLKVLMYEPVFVEDLMTKLKTKGIKCRLNQIIQFLDEQCITFRTMSWKTRNNQIKIKTMNRRLKTLNKGEKQNV